MEQLIWLLVFFPNVFFHLLLIFSILGLIGANFLNLTSIEHYKLPIQMLLGFILIFSIWMEGVIVRDEMCKKETKELQEKVDEAEKKAENTNTVIQEKIVEKTKYVFMKGDTIVEKIPTPGKIIEVGIDMSNEERTEFKRKIKEYEELSKKCPVLPRLAVDVHNEAATMTHQLKEEKK